MPEQIISDQAREEFRRRMNAFTNIGEPRDPDFMDRLILWTMLRDIAKRDEQFRRMVQEETGNENWAED